MPPTEPASRRPPLLLCEAGGCSRVPHCRWSLHRTSAGDPVPRSPTFMRSITLLSLLVATAMTSCARAPGGSASADSAPGVVVADTTQARQTTSAGPRVDSVMARADRGRMRGDSTAPVWVIMVSDFQCPYCRQWHEESFARLVREYVQTKKVRLAFMNYPLSIHPNALPASEAAMCAGMQGRFWEVHDALFASQKRWEGLADPMPTFTTIATRPGMDMAAWKRCVDSHTTRPLIEEDQRRGAAAGIRSTPTFFIGSRTMVGADKYDSLRVRIEAELRAARGKDAPR
jgi:protein-disulfide isomerase